MISVTGRKRYTAREIASITNGVITGDNSSLFDRFVTDSREVIAGSVFLSLGGDAYLRDALARGAGLLITSDENVTGNAIIVEDTVSALGKLAMEYRNAINAKVIGVTGSVGKTTVKEMIASVLSAAYTVRKSEGNHNNEIGLPMTLLGHGDESYSVLEIGARHPGDVAVLSKIAKPDFAVITNIGSAHLETFGSRIGIRDAKAEIAVGMRPGGFLLVPADEPLLQGYGTATFSVAGNADYVAVNIRRDGERTLFDAQLHGTTVKDLSVYGCGTAAVTGALIACAVASAVGEDEDAIRAGLMRYHGVPLRQESRKVGTLRIIADCYNASPESVTEALTVWSRIAKEEKRPFCVLLGDMRELGADSEARHRAIGFGLPNYDVSQFYTYGEASRAIADGAISAGFSPKRIFPLPESPGEASETLDRYLPEHALVLVKASRALGAERLISALKKRREGRT